MTTENKLIAPFWDSKTRFLHLGLALVVTFELFNSLIMEEPQPGRVLSGLEGVLFETHEWAGMAALLIIAVHWAWSLWGMGGSGLRHLLPYRTTDRAIIWQELRGLLAFRLPQGGPDGRLAGMIHGLGLLAVSVMALTGAVLFFGLPEDGSKSTMFVDLAEEAHEIFSTLAWVYWGGHGVMAVLHQLVAKDGALSRMFRLSS
jgi:cytochrome b561